jgi:hypothetical protein
MTFRPTKVERELPWAKRPSRAREARSDQDQAIDIIRFRVRETADNSGIGVAVTIFGIGGGFS